MFKPYSGNSPFIFISYSHKDTDEVLSIAEYLHNYGYNIWYDEGIDPGTEWDSNIAEHIEACAGMLAFISNAYIESDNCKDEINYARDLSKGRILVYLENVSLPSGMAMRLNRLQAIHKNKYHEVSDFYAKLVEKPLFGLEIREPVPNTFNSQVVPITAAPKSTATLNSPIADMPIFSAAQRNSATGADYPGLFASLFGTTATNSASTSASASSKTPALPLIIGSFDKPRFIFDKLTKLNTRHLNYNATIYLAHDRLTDHEYTLKEYHYSQYIAFFNSTDLLRRLQSIEDNNLCRIYDTDCSVNSYAVMEYAKGLALCDYLIGQKPEPQLAINIIRQLLTTLNKLHSESIVYGDVQPSNIIINGSEIKLCDYSETGWIGMIVNGRTVLLSDKYIVPSYGPELILTPQNDLYQAGVLLDELTIGFIKTAEDIAVLQGTGYSSADPSASESPINVFGNISAQDQEFYLANGFKLLNIIKRATCRDKRACYHTAEEMLADIRKLDLNA